MEYFKGDKIELNFSGATVDVFARIRQSLRQFYEEAYLTFKLGAIIYDDKLAPITEVIPRDIFIRNYDAIFDVWQNGGDYESYIFIFKQIFGPDAQIVFEKLRPAALKINVTTSRNSIFKWIENQLKRRYIKTKQGQQILLRQALGINDYYQVDGVLNSLKPAGFYLQVNLIIEED